MTGLLQQVPNRAFYGGKQLFKCSVLNTYRTSYIKCIRHVQKYTRMSSMSRITCIPQKLWVPDRAFSLQTPFLWTSQDSDLTVSSEEILQETNSVKLTTADEVCKVVTKLVHVKYGEVEQAKPWLQRNVHIAYIQLLMNSELEIQFQSIWNHPHMSELLIKINDVCEKFTPLEICSTYLGLLYMGLDPTCETSTKLMLHGISLVPQMDIVSLNLWSFVLKSTNREWQLNRPIFKRLKEMLADPEISWLNADMIHLSSLILNVVMATGSDRMLKLAANKLKTQFEDSSVKITPDELGTFTRLAKELFYNMENGETFVRDIIADIVDRCPKIMDQMEPHNIAEICHALKMCRCYERNLTVHFEQRSLELLSNDSRASDVSNLFYALGQYTPQDVRREFYNVLAQKINDVDVMLVSNLAESLIDLRINNRDLILAFQKQIVKHAEGIVAYSTRFTKVIRFLLIKKFLKSQDQKAFTDVVMKSVSEGDGTVYFYSKVAKCLTFLLPTIEYPLDDEFLEHVVVAIPRCHQDEIRKIALALTQMKTPQSRKLREQIGRIQTVIHRSILSKLDEVENLAVLYQMTLGLVLFSQASDPSLTHHILQKYLKFTASLTDVNVGRVAMLFSSLTYYLPELFDKLSQYMIENYSLFSADRIMSVVTSFAKVGYVPKDMAGFHQVALKAYWWYASKQLVREQLYLLQQLSVCQVFPEEALLHMFQIDTIQQLDKYMEEEPQYRNQVENLMTQLNRCVVLECPELDVPWFSEESCENIKSASASFKGKSFGKQEGMHSTSLTFWQDVEDILEDVLGGAKYLRCDSLSQYNHRIDFECLLDRNLKPMPAKHLDLPIPDDWQRVALLCHKGRSYCFDSKHLVGIQQVKKRHLEILGYKVVEVSHFEWYSMGLTDMADKVDYLHKKLFS